MPLFFVFGCAEMRPYLLEAELDDAVLVDVVGVVLYAVLADRNALLPTAAEGRSGDEGVDLEGHVLLKEILGAGLHPRSLNLDHPIHPTSCSSSS